MYIHYVRISVKSAFLVSTPTQKQDFNYVMLSVTLCKASCIYIYEFLRLNELTYHSSLLGVIPSGASCPNFNPRCQTLATIRKHQSRDDIGSFSNLLQTEGFPEVQCAVALYDQMSQAIDSKIIIALFTSEAITQLSLLMLSANCICAFFSGLA